MKAERKLFVFLGGMNAMPMQYAIELKKKHEVLYFVDAKKSDILSRPENHYQDISYPYPDWISEFVLLKQIIVVFFKNTYVKKILRIINSKYKSDSKKIFVLNGFFISLAPLLRKHGKIVCLSHGSDLDEWACRDMDLIFPVLNNQLIFKIIPNKYLKLKLMNWLVRSQYDGFSKSDVFLSFPKGFSPIGDIVINELVSNGANYFPRADISFLPLKAANRAFKCDNKELVIFSGVRFRYQRNSSGKYLCHMGYEEILIALSKFNKINKNIVVHFVEKGVGVDFAKKRCIELNLDKIVVWHKEMPFKSLIGIYEKSDICFDGVGKHWLGAIGGYALYLGKPLIANIDKSIYAGIFPKETPVCNAKSASEIYSWLVRLQENDCRRKISFESKLFAEKYLSCSNVIDEVFEKI